MKLITEVWEGSISISVVGARVRVYMCTQ